MQQKKILFCYHLIMKYPLTKIALFLCILVLVAARSQYRVVKSDIGSSSIRFDLQYTGSDSYYIKPTSPIIKDLTFVFRSYTFNDFDFKIYDSTKTRF